MSECTDDLGPDPDMDLEGGSWLEPMPDAKLGLVVPVDGDDLHGLERMAAETDQSVTDAVRELVREGLKARG